MSAKSLKEICKSLPVSIPGHAGQLTIMKRIKNDSWLCFYPHVVDKKVEVAKSNSLTGAVRKMHKQLIVAGFIKTMKKKKKKTTAIASKKQMSVKQKINRKLKIQKTNLLKK